MVFTYERVKDKPKLLRAMTGLDQDEFEEMLPSFEMAWTAYLKANRRPEPKRQRQAGGGRKPVLWSLADKLLFILYYFKIYPLQEIIGFEFGMGQSQTCEWIHILSEVQQHTLGLLNCLPERDPRAVATKLAQSGEIKYGIDGTERRIQRPKDPDRQRQYYSGKKHAHTVKNNVIVTLKSRQVKYLSQTYEGKTHDKKICDQEQPTFPSKAILYKDTGFQGYEPAGVETHQPKKKPRGQELSAKDKKRNRRISKVRIVAEHVLAGVKRCRIVKDVLRNTKAMFDDLVMEIACGLHNFRTALRSKRRRAKPYFR